MGVQVPRITLNANNEEGSFGELSLLSLGYGLHQAWVYASMFGGISIFGASPFTAGRSSVVSFVFFISIIVFGLCLCFAAITDQKFLKFYTSKKSLVAFAFMASLGTFAALGSSQNGALGLTATIVAGILTGVGSAGLILFWGTAFAREDGSTIVLNSAVALAIAILTYSVILHSAPIPYSGIVTAVLPLLELCILWKITPESYSKRKELPAFRPLKIHKGSFALQFFIPVVIFGFALGTLRETSIKSILPAFNLENRLLLLAAGCVATVLILITVWALRKQEHWGFLFRPLIPFIAIAAFFLPLYSAGNTGASSLLVLIGYMCFEVLMWIFFGELAQSFRLSPIFVFGLGRGALSLGALIGTLVSLQNFAYIAGTASSTVLILLAMVVAYAFLPSEKAIRKLIEPSYMAPEEIAPILAADQIDPNSIKVVETTETKSGRFKKRCLIIADRYLLSQREVEVLFFLAKGHNSTYIQDKLFISEGTAKTHVRHIYKKLDVHSQQELMKIVDDVDLGPDQN